MPTKKSKSNSSVLRKRARMRTKEYALLALILFLSISTVFFVYFLDVTKDLRNRAADIKAVCNTQCSQNSDCLSNMVCWPYGRPSDQKGLCRLDSNPSNDQCNERQGIGFIIQVYNDKNGTGTRENLEEGLSWDFTWDRNGDEDWRQYVTYAEKNGEGGRVADLNHGDKIRVRIKEKGGWNVVTPKEMYSIMATETTRVVYFGVRVPPAPSPTPKVKASPVVTKGGLGSEEEPVETASPSPKLGASFSPSPLATASLLPKPSTTPVAVPIQPQQPQKIGFLGWLRLLFRRLYCSITKSCIAE